MARISEIFTSIDGEVNQWGQGCFTTFIRFAGCNEKCVFCDTPQALSKDQGFEMSTDEIFQLVEGIGCRKVTITGGEPLIHGTAFADLLRLLIDQGYSVSVETNGSMSVPLDLIGLSTVNWVFDYKLPGSGMNHLNIAPSLWRSIPYGSWVKYVIIDWADFAEAIKHSSDLLESRPDVKIAFSACLGYPEAISPDDIIAACIDAEFFHVVFNLQIHKFIFPKGENISKTS